MSSSSNESVEELTAKLNTYKEQLSQVQALIASDPQNESFLKLQTDLLEVVNLTEDLVATQTNTSVCRTLH